MMNDPECEVKESYTPLDVVNDVEPGLQESHTLIANTHVHTSNRGSVRNTS